MELMATCLDKLQKRLKAPIPENILGKITVAVSSFSLPYGSRFNMAPICLISEKGVKF